MEIMFDEKKRLITLEQRGLDFLDSTTVFAGLHFTIVDDRQNYGEIRYVSFGTLNDRHVVIVWTEREAVRRIISMRYAHEEEIEQQRKALDRSR